MFNGPEPIYIQIADHIRKQILDGTISAGEQVMSTTQFATTYKINPATAAKGFAMLVDEGLLEKRRGIGMFVTDTAHTSIVADRTATYFDRVLDPALQEADNLGIPVTDILAYVSNRGRATN